jgi:hypothetical protein
MAAVRGHWADLAERHGFGQLDGDPFGWYVGTGQVFAKRGGEAWLQRAGRGERHRDGQAEPGCAPGGGAQGLLDQVPGVFGQ